MSKLNVECDLIENLFLSSSSKMFTETDNLDITKEEQQLILHLKANVWEILPEPILTKSDEDQDLYFVRWIRARDHDLDKATEMLRNHLKWRVERNADNALKFEIHPFFTQNYRYTVSGVDRKGRPVICIPLSEWDFRKVVNIPERIDEFDDFVTHKFETLVSILENRNKKRSPDASPITQLTFLIDAKDYPYGQLIRLSAIKKILQFAVVYEAHYAEILNRVIFINCPVYFGLFMSLLKPVLAPKTMKKLILYTSMAKWKAELDQIIDPSVTPERYGGTTKV